MIIRRCSICKKEDIFKKVSDVRSDYCDECQVKVNAIYKQVPQKRKELIDKWVRQKIEELKNEH